MLKKLEGMKMQKKLNFGYSVVIGLMILSGFISIVGLASLYWELQSYVNGAQKADTAVKECRININTAARNMLEMALNDDTGTYSQYKGTVEDCLVTVGDNIEVLKSTDIITQELCGQYVEALNEWGPIAYNIIEMIEAGSMDEALSLILSENTPALEKVVTLSRQIDEVTDAKKAKAISLSKIIAIVGCISIIAFVCAASALAAKIGKCIVASILTPMQELNTVAGKLAAGDLHIGLAYDSEDEIGSMAHNLRQAVGILSSYVDDILRIMQEFSKGNFDVQPSGAWEGDFQGIQDALLQFERSMADMVKGIQRVADKVSSNSQQVALGSAGLAQGAQEQTAITADLSESLASISDQVSQNADHAEDISQKVEKLGAEIISGNEKMQEMIGSMNEINQASMEISKIIATINDIASKTNLLALNASIEAARAGEAGKGFVVVANQVSVLAAQSSEAAKESTLLIGSSVKAVENGMVIADETAQQLKNVVDSSKAITKEVNEIAIALETQTSAISQIDDGVVHINDVVETNSRSASESAAISQEMSGQAENLEGLIRKIKVGKFK